MWAPVSRAMRADDVRGAARKLLRLGARRARAPLLDGKVAAQRELLQAEISLAPAPAASEMPAASAASCTSRSGCQRSWTAPILRGARTGGLTRAGESSTAGASIRGIPCTVSEPRGP